MLEVFIPGVRYSGIIDTSDAHRGSFCYISGVDSDGNIKLNVPTTTTQAVASFYPINKYYFEEDLNDTSNAVDKPSKGDTVIYYDAGEYGTDQFDASSFGISISTAVSSATGATMYMPGSATAGATVGLSKVFVSTAGDGKLWGDTSMAPTLSTTHPIGFVTGAYYSDSVTTGLMLRIRTTPANQNLNVI